MAQRQTGQTGSHRTGPRSSSPGLAPSHPAHPSGPGSRESGSQLPVVRPEPSTTVPSQSLRGVQNRGSIHRKGGPTGRPQRSSCSPWREAYWSLLLMITPTSPSGHSAFRACAGPYIPMATVAGPPTQCEWATSQVLPNWDDGETFWESAQPTIFPPFFCLLVIVFWVPLILRKTL